MAERISGLSIDLSMDDAGISRSMTNIKNSFRDLKRSAQVNLNNIKFDSKDVNTYKKNLNELSKSFDNQKKNVNDLKKNYDMLVATQGEGSKEAQSARIEYNKQADELNKLGHALDNAKDGMQELYVESSKFKSIETGLEGISTKMQTVGDGMTSVGKSMTAAITAPILGAIAGSIKSFADLEQAVGGVETLFKDSADTVIKNSESAYKRAGVSGVDYMENVTSFSATLLQGLEGDTEAAAKAADMAMVDMSDNANKFGTNIGDVQNAYQGFAKDNFTMLDNLKLGYGGTAGEMARLVNESGVLGDAMDVTAETVKDVPFDKMIEAIHEVQTEMGVTGTTVKEAEETVSGSFGMMKASFMDLSAGFGQEGANIEGLFENLWSSVGAFTDNIKRVLGDIWDNLPMDEWQKWAGAIGIAAGPILLVFGTIISTVAKVIGSFAPLFGWLAKMSGGFKTVYNGVKPFAVVFPKLAGLTKLLAGAFTFLTGPVGLTIAAITALGAGFVIAYNKSETFRNFIDGLKEKFSSAMEWIGNFKDGIIGLFKGEGTEGVDILTSIGLSEGLVEKLFNISGYFLEFYHRVKDIIGNVITTISGIFEIFKGNHIGAEEMLSSVGLSEETIDSIFLAVAKIKLFFTDMGAGIKLALDTVGNFFRSVFNSIGAWWAENGQAIIGAVVTGFTWMKDTLKLVFDLVVAVVRFAFNMIKGVFDTTLPILLGIWNLVWNTIKGTIQIIGPIISGIVKTAIDIIVNAFNYFAPIVMGIWNTVWPAIKLTLTNVWEIIKSVVRIGMDFVQTVIKTVTAIINGDWSAVWETIKGFTSRTFETIKQLFVGMTNRAKELISGMVTNIKNWFVNMYNDLKSRVELIYYRVTGEFRKLKNTAVNTIRELFNLVKNWFSNLFSTVTSTVNNLKTDVVNKFVNMKDGAIDGVRKLYTGTKNLFNDVKDYAKDTFTNMVDGAKELPGKLGSAISNGASKAVDGVKSLGNKMTGKLGSVVNGVIDGLNSITGKIGISSTISKWNVPTFSTGTGQGSPSGKLTKNGKIAMDTLATVGDKGKGNGSGTRELVHYPNGKVGLYDNDATIFAPKGTTIFSNQETEALLGQIPKFSEGTGLWGSIKQLAGKAIDYITNPKKIFDDLIALVGDSFGDMTGFAGNFIKGAWSMIKDGMFGWIKGKFSEASVGKSQKWMDYKMTTPYSPNAPVPGYPTSFNGGRHYGIDYGTPVGVNITSPMAGTVSRMSDRGGGNVARLDAAGNVAQYFMHMNSVKTGKVGIGDSVGKSGNTGEWTTGPHVHWQHEDPSASYVQNRFTKNPLSMIKGHLKGGQILSDGLFNLHKGEYVINPNEPTEAMKLLAIVGKKLAGKSKQTREVASVGDIGSDNSVMHELLDATLKQNQILMKLLNKKTDIYMDEQKVGGIIDEHNAVNASLQMF